MSEIKPAMTAEEWAKRREQMLDGFIDMDDGIIDVVLGRYSGRGDEEAQALAALLLHGQPFGFTWDDVDELRAGSNVVAGDNEKGLLVFALRSTADRIAALLPPRET